jgi:MFS family permease
MLIIFTIIMSTGIIIQTAAHSMNDMVIGRLVAGVGNGGNTATAPVWHVETSHHSAKGSAVVKEMAVNVLGFVLSNFITLAFSGLMTEAQWRFPLGIQLLFCVIILAMVPILPESPRWLLARKRDEEAKVVLNHLNDEDAQEEFEAIQASVKAEQAVKSSWSQLLRGGLATRRVFLGMMLQVAQQLSGISQSCSHVLRMNSRLTGPRCTRVLPSGRAPQIRWTSSVDSSIGSYGKRGLFLAFNLCIDSVCRESWSSTTADDHSRYHGSCIPRCSSRCWRRSQH